LPWVARLAERFVTERSFDVFAGVYHDDVQAILNVAAESAPVRRPA